VYSRHPDPRRLWKGGSEQHLLTPLPGNPRAPGALGAPGASSKNLYLVMFYNDFGTLARSFYRKSNEYTRGSQGKPKGLQRMAKGSRRQPKGRQREPKASQRDLKARPKGAHDIPKGFKRTARESQRHPKGRQREPKASQRETKWKGRQKGRAGKASISTNSRSTAQGDLFVSLQSVLNHTQSREADASPNHADEPSKLQCSDHKAAP
jgi:hypothetical protein